MSRLWPFGSHEQETGERTASPEERLFLSRALQDLMSYLPRGGGWRVLDLGRASNVNLAFFSPFRAHYTIEDLLGTVDPCRNGGTFDLECVRGLSGLLDFDDEATFDLVLAWDLLNYVPREVIRVVAERLTPHCREGCLLYSLVWRQREMPRRPCRCELVDHRTIRQTFPDAPMAPISPRYTDSVLNEALSPFRVEKAYLLKHGMQEYILEVDAAS